MTFLCVQCKTYAKSKYDEGYILPETGSLNKFVNQPGVLVCCSPYKPVILGKVKVGQNIRLERLGLRFDVLYWLCFTESVTYQFGLGKGLVVFEYPEDERPSTRTDYLALGITTIQTSQAQILRIDSADTDDNIEVELVSISHRCMYLHTYMLSDQALYCWLANLKFST